jgi:tRNA pseudouridine55 synthase
VNLPDVGGVTLDDRSECVILHPPGASHEEVQNRTTIHYFAMKQQDLHGLLVVDKPGGMTSRDVVNRAQGWFPRGTRLGHTGTLDPLATGVLVLCVGVATRLTELVQDMGKTYRAGLLLGVRSDTEDADGELTPVAGAALPDEATATACLGEFVGQIEQVPPAYSAAKVAGRRAYDLARRGQDVTLQPRQVRIDGIDVVAFAPPRLEIEVRCGKGTYIRSLARDLGDKLGCGALVETLRRTRVGPFTVNEAVTLDATPAEARTRLLPLSAAAADLPALPLSGQKLRQLTAGQVIQHANPMGESGLVAVFGPDGQLYAVAQRQAENECLRPTKVFLLERGAGLN